MKNYFKNLWQKFFPAPPAPPATTKAIPILKEYRVEIFNGAGMVKINAKGFDMADAKQKALKEYASKLTVRIRPL
jgi:hypothetical protein